MSDYIKISLKILWMILIVYWVISGFSVKKVKKTESIFKNFFFYWMPLMIAVLLLGPGEWFGKSWLRENFIAHTNTVGITGLLLCAAGVAICCRARYILGKNWSLSVQQKENHELITSGIYRTIRHPIYTGLLLLFVGNGIIVGDNRAIIAVCIVLISFLFKIRKEENTLTELFGDNYTNYKKSTYALIPFLY